jgi:hypothetical protein
VAVKRDQQPAFIDKVYNALRRKGSGIHLEEVIEAVGCETAMDPDTVFGIASTDERIAVSVGRFVYLREWGEPRRITLKGALDRLAKQVTGPTSINDIKDRLEFFTERKIEKSTVSNMLSSSGMSYLGDGIWQINDRRSAEEED